MKDLVEKVEAEVPAKTENPESKVETLYRLKYTPRGTKLFTYFCAVLSIAGGFTSGRKTMDAEKIASFFATKTCVRHHLACGNLEETKTGVRLTVAGWNYLHGRLTGSNVAQKVDEPEMKALMSAIKAGKLEKKTERFPANTEFVPIKG